ncbi:MAG: type II toxin-antitoxin system RelE/ParE family toxin [Alphaproteobacteria bacterium]|nr:type II toxin-antitoxin system RelE/ParE family toxin [Alphaproteobacteria bacterium]
MSSFTLTKKALEDLIEIGRYTQKQWGTEQRNRYLGMIDDCFQKLARHPLTGKDCAEIRNGYRKIGVGRHIVFYRQTHNHEIEIVRVLHERMDIETNLSMNA